MKSFNFTLPTELPMCDWSESHRIQNPEDKIWYYQSGKNKGKKKPRAKVLMKLNFNVFRNIHFQVKNNTKINFKKSIEDQLQKSPKFSGKIMITYKLFVESNRRSDIDNVMSVIKKYFQDALVESGVIIDDNYNHIVINMESFGGVDKDNPRVEATVAEIDDDALLVIENIFKK